jgi:hypothetical protein
MTTTAAAPSLMPDALAGGDRAAVLLERRPQPAEAAARSVSTARVLVGVELDRFAFFAGDLHGNDLGFELAPPAARRRTLLALAANSSCSSRLMPYLAAMFSAVIPCGRT